MSLNLMNNRLLKKPNPPKKLSNYQSNYNTDYKMQSNNYSNKFNKPAASFALFNYSNNYLESPFFNKKMNDVNYRKYRQKLNKQQQYWAYTNKRGIPFTPTNHLFLNGIFKIDS